MDSPDEGGSGHSDLSAGERFSRFTKRNVLLTVVLFSSSLVTAVSTLVTAVVTLNNSRSDWHPAEYRKLRELHAGYSIEKFREKLGVPAFRIPFGTGPNDDLPDEGYTKNVFRPRQDYWVEVISDPTGRTVTYSVTSCRADFQPTFSFRGGKETVGEFKEFRLALNKTSMSEALPAKRGLPSSIQAWFAGAGGRAAFVGRVFDVAEDSDYRQFAWGLNDVCRPWLSTDSKADSFSVWESWYVKNRAPLEAKSPLPATAQRETDELMARSLINTYTESAVYATLTRFYPSFIGVYRLDVR
ncbi:hypothetical protein [Streptomyces sp. NPDC058398]|uniref:hypothetical protein n=1 Tax=Streptomyces sp. NPDC058398 TaxID=3346479 RepID=UPI00365C6221